MSRTKWLPILVVLAFLLASWTLDLASTSIHNFAAATFRTTLGYTLLLLIELVFAGLVLFLAWYYFFKTGRSVTAGAIFIVFGLLGLIFSSHLRVLLPSISRPGIFLYQIQDLPQPQRAFTYLMWYLSHQTGPARFLSTMVSFGYLTKASAITLLMGVIAFFRRKA